MYYERARKIQETRRGNNPTVEPTVAYNSMAYLELEAEKAELIRTIANIDSKEIIDKVKQKLHDVLGLKEKTVVKKTVPCQLTEDEIKEEIEQAIDEIQQGQTISSQEMHTTFKHYLL